MLMVHVNGKDYEVEQDTKLMRFLRDDLRLTSVRMDAARAHAEPARCWWMEKPQGHVFQCFPSCRENL